MQTTRRITLAISLAAICTAGITGQTQETKTTTKTKIEIKGGKEVTLAGCLERRPAGDYILTQVREKGRFLNPSAYALVTSEDLSKHVGERVEVTGKAVANGNGKVTVESTTKIEVEDGKDSETKTKTEGTGGALELPLLGVKTLKALSPSCN